MMPLAMWLFVTQRKKIYITTMCADVPDVPLLLQFSANPGEQIAGDVQRPASPE